MLVYYSVLYQGVRSELHQGPGHLTDHGGDDDPLGEDGQDDPQDGHSQEHWILVAGAGCLDFYLDTKHPT